ncbi:MAG TPA: YceI family protein [Gemmatimonadales bacterium]|nr:YceI family protein [Gemmatimonadales bacterium]
MLPHFAQVVTAVALAAAPAPATVEPVTWKIDVTHSELIFRVRHLVSRVPGTFREWSGAIVADPADWNAGSVEIVIQAASIDTRHEKRDTHLRSADFFDVANHPTLTFRSTSVQVSGESVTLKGDLTIRGTTKPVTLTGETLGTIGEGAGKQRVGFHVTTKINRLDYGLTWNRAAEGGGLVLGDEVEIDVTVAAVRQ